MNKSIRRACLAAGAAILITACAPSVPGGKTATPQASGPLFPATAAPPPTDKPSAVPPTPTPVPEIIGPDNVTSLMPWRDLARQPGLVRALAFSPNSAFLASATGANPADADLHLRVWSLANGGLLAEGPKAPGIIWDIAFSPDGQVLASGEDDGAVRLWRSSDLTPLGELRMSGAVNSLAFSPDGHQLAAGTAEITGGIVYVWDVAQAQVLRQWKAELDQRPEPGIFPGWHAGRQRGHRPFGARMACV